MEVTFAHIAS